MKVAIIVDDNRQKFSQSEKNTLLGKILDNAIIATGVDDVCAGGSG